MIGWDKVLRFMGSKQATTPSQQEDEPCKDAVASEDVPIAILANKIMAETDAARKAALEQQLLEELQV